MKCGLRYDWGGKFTSRGAWIHPDTVTETWEFLYMLHGTTVLYEEETELRLSAGDALLFAPGKRHGGREKTGEEERERVSFFWLHFYPDAAGHAMLSALPRYAHIGESSQIPLFCRQLLHVSVLSAYPRSMSDALMGMILTEYAVRTGEGEQSREERLLSDICEWIRINADRKLTVKEVAAQFEYQEDYLARVFREKLGMGLKPYIDNARMEKLRTLLLTTDEPLKSIAARTGFEDYKAFLKYFTYHGSMTPTKLREQYYRTHTNNY